jgi:diguanylate cyclase (GGDEF)-like protein/PAS domain S-box-containing protein
MAFDMGFIARSDLALLVVDRHGAIQAAGGGARRALDLGIEGRDDLGSILLQIDGGSISNEEALAILKTSRPGQPVECRIRTSNNLEGWVLATLTDMPGDEAAFLVEVTPIDRQKSAMTSASKELEHLSFALDATGQGVWDYNGATDVWYFSPAWKRMRGIPEDEAYVTDGHDWLDSVHPDDRDFVQEINARQYAGELAEVEFEYRERHRDGHWMWIKARGRCMEGRGDGKPLRIVGTDVDVTALRDSQAALGKLERSELRWKIAVDSAQQGVWDHDLITGERYYSQTWRAIRGLGPEDPVPDTDLRWLDRVHPDDRERVGSGMTACMTGAADQISIEYREQDKNGDWIWILRRGKPVAHDELGWPTRFIGTDTVVSDLKAREIEFETLSRRLEMALSTSAIGVWETSLATGEAFWDARTYELFGLTPSQAPVPPGMWESLVHPDDRQRIIELCSNSLEATGGYGCDYRALLHDGTIRHVRCRAKIVHAADGADKIIGVNWDVTPDIELADALRRAKQLAEAHSRDLEAAHRNMEYASLHDSLTNLPNRRFLDRSLAAFKGDDGSSLVLLHIDLDRFKQINDTKGHAAGDALLIHIAGLLRSQVRPNDIVARIGGDEFVVLMSPAPDRHQVQSIVDGIIANAALPMIWNGHECRSGVSIGIAEWTPGVDARQLLINADIALYRAKRTGRNCACLFSDSLHDEVVTKKQCADDIMNGLERSEFEPWYQLQFDARTLEIVGLEALVRWNHPTRGLLSPMAFLEVASDINAMATIDATILNKAALALAQWDSLGISIPRVSVNVSARRLGDETLIKSLDHLPIAPSRISFELLESIFLDDEDQALSLTIESLKRLGFKIEIDDFGTGHASIASLLRIKPHRLKIDRQLVMPIVESASQRLLVRSIIEIGKSQQIAICAEGIETARHAEILRDLGCDSLQGYFLARPMPASAIPAFVRAKSWLGPDGPRPVIPDGSALRAFLAENGIGLGPAPAVKRPQSKAS